MELATSARNVLGVADQWSLAGEFLGGGTLWGDLDTSGEGGFGGGGDINLHLRPPRTHFVCMVFSHLPPPPPLKHKHR